MKNKIKSTKKKLPAIGEEEYIQKLLKLNDNLLMELSTSSLPSASIPLSSSTTSSSTSSSSTTTLSQENTANTLIEVEDSNIVPIKVVHSLAKMNLTAEEADASIVPLCPICRDGTQTLFFENPIDKYPFLEAAFVCLQQAAKNSYSLR